MGSVHDILAISMRSVYALVVSELHETLFASTSDGVGIARRLYENMSTLKDLDSGK